MRHYQAPWPVTLAQYPLTVCFPVEGGWRGRGRKAQAVAAAAALVAPPRSALLSPVPAPDSTLPQVPGYPVSRSDWKLGHHSPLPAPSPCHPLPLLHSHLLARSRQPPPLPVPADRLCSSACQHYCPRLTEAHSPCLPLPLHQLLQSQARLPRPLPFPRLPAAAVAPAAAAAPAPAAAAAPPPLPLLPSPSPSCPPTALWVLEARSRRRTGRAEGGPCWAERSAWAAAEAAGIAPTAARQVGGGLAAWRGSSGSRGRWGKSQACTWRKRKRGRDKDGKGRRARASE